MMRISAAVPEVPITTTGIQRCASRSTNLPQDQGASMYSGENSPPTLCPK